MPSSKRAGEGAAFPAVHEFLELKHGSGDDTGSPLLRALWLVEDLAELGSKPDGFDFEGFNMLVERARDVLRLAKGRRSLIECPEQFEATESEQGRDWLEGKAILEEGGAS